MHTWLVSLGHDMANVIVGSSSKDIPQALSALLSFDAQSWLVVICGFLAMSDQEHHGFRRDDAGNQSEDIGNLHLVPTVHFTSPRVHILAAAI